MNKPPASRKIRAFIIMALMITGFTVLTTKAGTPESIATNGLWAIAIGGLFTIGGQSLVDSIRNWKQPTGNNNLNPQ